MEIYIRRLTSVAGLFLNGTKMPEDYNYNDPSTAYDINEQDQRTSQRFRVELASVNHNSGLTTN
jgi:hypothetical protein